MNYYGEFAVWAEMFIRRCSCLPWYWISCPTCSLERRKESKSNIIMWTSWARILFFGSLWKVPKSFLILSQYTFSRHFGYAPVFVRPLWKCSSSPDLLCTFIASEYEWLHTRGPFGNKRGGKSKSSVSYGSARPWLFPLLSSGETMHAWPTIVHLILCIVINMMDILFSLLTLYRKKTYFYMPLCHSTISQQSPMLMISSVTP